MRSLAILGALCVATAFAQPAISTGGVLDGAGFVVGQAIAPGSLVSIFGTGLATSLLQGDTVPLSTSIGGTSVTMNGIPAPLYFVSAGQVNAQVPWNVLQGAASGTANVVVSLNGANSLASTVNVNQFSPNIFAAGGFAIAINPDGQLAAPAGAIPGLSTHPARPGDTLILYANGLGPVDQPVDNGAPGFPPLRTTTTTPTVLFGGVAVTPAFSGLTPQFPGVNQINVVVPSGVTGSAVPLQLRSGGITSSDKVVIAIAP